MTLNITLVTSSRIYQSSDFKLTIPATGEIVSLSSTKLVQLQYPIFDGFLTYTGVGRWPRRDSVDTSARVVEWLSGASGLSFEQLVDKVREEGQRFLKRVEVANGRQRHTFTVAAFINGIPKVALISNYEYANGRTLPSPSPDLTISDRTYRGSSFVVITGQRGVVHRNRRRQLERLGDLATSTPNQIRDSLAKANALAAPASRGTVSVDCSVLSIDASGRGYHELSPGSRVEPLFVMNGATMPDMCSLLRSLDMGSNQIFVGGSFATSKQMDMPTENCVPSITSGDAEYTLADISVPGMAESRPLAIGPADSEVIIGVSSPPENRGRYQYWRWSESSGHTFFPMKAEGELGATLLADGSVVVTASLDDHLSVVRLDGSQSVIFDQASHFDAAARVSNRSGLVAGWVGGANSQDRSQASRRPAVWTSEGNLTVLDDKQLLGTDWGYVVDLNDSGIALVLVYVGKRPTPLLWDIVAGNVTPVDNSQNVIPVSLDDRSCLIAFSNDSRGEQIALTTDDERRWRRLGTAPGWLPLGLNHDFSIVGRVRVAGFLVPSIWQDGVVRNLSSYRYHHAQADAISDQGVIIGQATADHGIHALIWRPR